MPRLVDHGNESVDSHQNRVAEGGPESIGSVLANTVDKALAATIAVPLFDMEKEIAIRVKKYGSAIRDDLRFIYENFRHDPVKLPEVTSIVDPILVSQFRKNIIKALAASVPACGSDLERFRDVKDALLKICKRTHGSRQCFQIASARNVYGSDFSWFMSLVEYMRRRQGRFCQALISAAPVYGTDFGKYLEVADILCRVAKNGCQEASTALTDIIPHCATNLEQFREAAEIIRLLAVRHGRDACGALTGKKAINRSFPVLRYAITLVRFGGRFGVLARQLDSALAADPSLADRCEELNPLIDRLGALGPAAARQYLAEKDAGDSEVFFHRAESLARYMDANYDVFSALSADDRALAQEIASSVFAPTAGAHGRPDDLAEYPDRSADLADLKVLDEYPVSVLGHLEFEECEPVDRAAVEMATSPVAHALGSMLGTPEENLKKLTSQATMLLGQAPGLPRARLAEGKILLAAIASGPKSRQAAKGLVTDYRFRDGRVRDYVQRSAAQGEALPSELARLRHTLSYLSEFYRDDLKEAIKSLVDTARENDPDAVHACEAALARQTADRSAAASRLRDPAALKKALSGLAKIPDETVRRARAAVILRKNGWEGDESGLPADEAGLTSLVDDLAAGKASISITSVPTLESALHELFHEEVVTCDREMAKIVPKSNGEKTTALRLTGKILKTPYSALARLPAGVCVSADKPGANPEYCMWTDPSYLQMVFFNPDAKFPSCEGLVMMHRYEDAGRKVLMVSVNPSNSFVLASDGQALFAEILKSVVTFAQDNGFDFVCASNNPGVRTNRAGVFSAALEKACAGDAIILSQNYRFSGTPGYWQCRLGASREPDLSVPVLWKRG